MIRPFPHFTPVDSTNASEFAQAIDGHLPYSSFNFVSLRCYWPDAQVARFGDGIALVLSDPVSGQSFLTVLNRESSCHEQRELFAYSQAANLDNHLRLVPECSLPSLGHGITVQERRDAFDYIVSIDSMLTPAAESVRLKHQLAEEFLANHPNTRVKEISLEGTPTRSELEDAALAWRSARTSKDQTHEWEHSAFVRCIAHQSEFALVALAAFSSSGSVLGFTINAALNNGYYMAHFGKVRPSCRGLSELLELETARLFRARGCTDMNFQEDLANSGLRRMKESWQPRAFLKVFDVQPTH